MLSLRHRSKDDSYDDLFNIVTFIGFIDITLS